MAVFGESIIDNPGMESKVFDAFARKNINVEIFAGGASEVAFIL
ncbi:MAG: ACT domain-containing protein [Thermoplasmata archaeon]